MSINEIVNYVNRTPHNTNPNVIASMVQGTNEQAVYESVEKLKRDGGVGYSEKNVFNYDGKGDVEWFDTEFIAPDLIGVIDRIPMAKIVDEGIDLHTITKVTAISEGIAVEANKNALTILTLTETVDETGPQLVGYVARTQYAGMMLPIILNVYGRSTYVLSDPNVGDYISRIETETVRLIDPKYLPEEATPKIVNLNEFTVKEGGILAGATLSMNIMYLCWQSINNDGAAQSAELTLNDETFNKECASESNVILKVTADMGTRLVDVYFPVTVAVTGNGEEKATLSVHGHAVLNLGGLMNADFCLLFSTYNKFEMHVKATPFV